MHNEGHVNKWGTEAERASNNFADSSNQNYKY